MTTAAAANLVFGRIRSVCYSYAVAIVHPHRTNTNTHLAPHCLAQCARPSDSASAAPCCMFTRARARCTYRRRRSCLHNTFDSNLYKHTHARAHSKCIAHPRIAATSIREHRRNIARLGGRLLSKVYMCTSNESNVAQINKALLHREWSWRNPKTVTLLFQMPACINSTTHHTHNSQLDARSS